LLQIARQNNTTLLVGGNSVTGWTVQGKEHIGSEIRNSAYFINPNVEPPLARYDKVFLARFSERAPLTIGPEWLRRFAALISAPRATQPMFAGELRDLRPFELHAPDGKSVARFITPICLENIDPAIIAKMVRGASLDGKQADFVANISNDGWFSTQEKHQHLQTTIFRCIENRVPMVRCSNTGISAFIDSTGYVQPTIGANQSGVTVAQIELDGRRTFYTRHGDVFAVACVVLAAAAAAWKFVERRLA
jgi:apolipoprotein N-acyltransferase